MKILSSARIAVLDADLARRAALCAALTDLGMRRLHPVGSLDEARALTAAGPVDLCIVHPHDLEAIPTGRFPLYPFDPAVTPAILIASDTSRETVRAAAACGYRVLLASPAAPRLVYRRIGSILQKVRRRRRNGAPKLAPASATSAAELQGA